MSDGSVGDGLLHDVLIEPGAFIVRVRDGQTLMAAAFAADVRWPSVCGGVGQCGVCHVELIASDESLPPPDAIEASMLRRSHLRPKMGGELRLACQLPITARATVHKRGVRRVVPEMRAPEIRATGEG